MTAETRANHEQAAHLYDGVSDGLGVIERALKRAASLVADSRHADLARLNVRDVQALREQCAVTSGYVAGPA